MYLSSHFFKIFKLRGTRVNKRNLFIISLIFISLVMMASVSASDDLDVASSAGNVADVNIEVNYEYNENINPQIIVSQDNSSIPYEKTSEGNKYIIALKDVDASKNYTVSVSAHGYADSSQIILLDSNKANNLVFNLKATDTYKIGYDITADADKRLDFKNADEVLVITTAGLTRIDGTTTEDVLDGIINAADGFITYGQGNILTLSAIRTDPTNFAFVVKKANGLTMAFYRNATLAPVYVGTVDSANMNANKWKELQKLLGSEDAYSYVSLANAWAAGLPSDVLTQAAYHGHVCTGLISGQAMIHTLLKYFPPRGENGVTPLESTAYYVVGVPGGSDDDAFVWTMDITPGKRAYVGVDTMVNKSMTGFIRWNETSNTGILILMSYNEDAIKNEFKTATGLNPDASAANDLKYQKWLVDKLAKDPESLVTIVDQLGNLTQEQLIQIMGTSDASIDVDARGLDLDYIYSLNLTHIDPDSNKEIKTSSLSENDLIDIGRQAAMNATAYFKSINITIEKDMPNFYVLTSAGFVRIGNVDTTPVFDGISEVLGSRLSRATLLPVHTALWKDLVFDFFWLDPLNNKNTASYSLLYNQTTGTFEICAKQYNIQDNSIKYGPAYDILLAWLFHNHVCPGGSPGILLADKVFDELPLGENETYMLVTTLAYCKDDTLSRLLGVSPGMQNYHNLRLSEISADGGNKSSYVNIIIRWNEQTQTGTATLAQVAFPKFATGGSANYEEWNKLFKGDYSSPGLVRAPLVEFVATKEINKEILDIINSGAYQTEEGDAVAYFMGLNDTLPVVPSTDKNGNDNGGNTKTNDGGSKSDSKSSSSSKSNGNGKSSNIGTSTSVGQSSSPIGTAYAASDATPVASEESSSADESSADSNKKAGGSSDSSKSYEIEKKEQNEIDYTNLMYGLVFALILVGAVAGVMYVRRK